MKFGKSLLVIPFVVVLMSFLAFPLYASESNLMNPSDYDILTGHTSATPVPDDDWLPPNPLDTITELEPPCNHSYEIYIDKTDPHPCNGQYYITYGCKYCDATETTGVGIGAPMNHAAQTLPRVEPTCTSTGLTEGSQCSRYGCKEIIVAQKTIPMLPHKAKCVKLNGTSGTILETTCITCGQKVSYPHLDAESANLTLIHTYSYSTTADAHMGHCDVCGYSGSFEKHSYTNGMCVCGEAQGVTLDENIKILHSLNLTSGIEINFVVPAAQLEGYDSYYLECVSQISGEIVTIMPVRNGNYYYFTLNKLTAFKMNDLYDATLHMTKDGAPYVSNMDSYSVAAYAYAQLNLENSGDKMKRLCANLLQYGAAAQTWKNYRLDALATDAMTEVHKGYLADSTGVTFTDNYKVLSDIENPQINIVRKTLSVESKIVVRYVVDATNYLDKLDQLSMRVTYQGVDGTQKTVILDKCENYIAGTNYYVFDLEDLLAAELRTVVSAAVYEGDTQISTTMQYSVDSYGVPTTGTVRALCQAMLAYGDSALAYFS